MKKVLTLAALALVFAACKKEKNEEPTENANEEITTLTLTFVNNSNSADVVTAVWKDLDGPGGTAPVITPITLKKNTTYTLATTLLDERMNPAADVTAEIEEEGDEHRVFHLFFSAPGAAVADSLTSVATVTPLDVDSNGLPVGLNATVAVNGAFTGYLRCVVRHQPGSKDGKYGPGSTDVLTEFSLTVN